MSSEIRLPADLDAERALLGAITLEPGLIEQAAAMLEPGDFFLTAHKTLFDAMGRLSRQNMPCDGVSVVGALRDANSLERANGAAYISSLMNDVIQTDDISHYARRIKAKAVRRSLIAGCNKIVETAGDGSVDDKELIEQAEKLIFEVTQARHDKQFEIAGVFTQSALEKVESGGIRGTSTHLIDLDYLLGGFQRQDQIIIAARPSQGKTALALSMALNMAAQGSGVGIFSLEMSGEQLGLRLLSMVSRVDSHKIKSGDLTREEWARVSDANSYINSLPIYIDDSSGLNYLEIKSKARRLVALANIEALFVDYMQLVRSPGKVESRNREIGDVSQGLKELAKELNLPVFALSQLSRQSEQRGDKEPQLSDLRDSGEIEQNADVVMFIHRDEYYNPTSENSGVARLLIRKNRNGPVGEVQLSFDKRLTFFGNLAR